MLVEVGAPDSDAIYGEALDWSDPDLGLITVVVPPIVNRLSDVLRPVIRALDGAALERPASDEAQSVESSLARLRAHGIRALIVLHGQWIPASVFSALVSGAALIGIDLFVVTHPDDETTEVAPDWRTEMWGWADLRAWIARLAPVWRQAASSPIRHQRVVMPTLGLYGRVRPVSVARPSQGPAEFGFEIARRRLPVAPPLHLVATIVRQVVRSVGPEDVDAVTDGTAAAVSEAGFALLRGDRDRAPIEWRALRRIPDTTQAAAVTLMALGLDEPACARLETAAVNLEAGQILTRDRLVPCPPAAWAYLAAQRFVRAGGREAFLTVRGHAVGPAAIRALVVEGLRAAGRALDDRDFDRGLSPSQRWLMERGLLVRRTRDADIARLPEERDEVRIRRCRHGLPAWIEVTGGERVSHSQSVCRAVEVGEARPASAGYAVDAVETLEQVTAYRVRNRDGDHGALWSVETPLGRVWVQSLARRRPTAAEVGGSVRAAQMARPAPAGRTR